MRRGFMVPNPRYRLSEEKVGEIAFELSIRGCIEKLDDVVKRLEERGVAKVVCGGEELVFDVREGRS